MELRKRKLKLEGMTCSGCEQRIEEALQELKGVKSVDADYKTGKLRLEYDIVKTSLKEIEPCVEHLDYSFSSGLFSRIKRGFIHDADKTARENYLADRTIGCSLGCCKITRDNPRGCSLDYYTVNKLNDRRQK